MEGTLGMIIFFVWFFAWAFIIQEKQFIYYHGDRILVMRWEAWAINFGLEKDSIASMLFMFFIYPAGWYAALFILNWLGLIWVA